MGQIRLYIPQRLNIDEPVDLSEQQSHYLCNVMKIKENQILYCFDNQSGEYRCVPVVLNKKHTVLRSISMERPYIQVPDVWLIFAPVKKDNTDFIIQKATELGARRIIPVLTRYTISERIKKERFEANSIEAAEQCRRTDLPEISEVVKFVDLLQKWDKKRILYYMDETLAGDTVAKVFAQADVPCAIMVGPEGGFSTEELATLRKASFAKAVNLGQRILRAETAVVAALSCWQALSGDWQ
ncbi:MAG: 16S rRNA (uracil(1498)-N(3))-methyltransferase [Alphaproteobacteria bacterium]|nr:16S rRNA (uracil(1498)-N(3))-methyltransferase [Alphaproteobacteria bacterium]